MSNIPIPISQHEWDGSTKQLVSISCSTYNHEDYIRDAIEGFLMQKTTFPVRIVIFEDCSTDSTASIIKEYEEKYPNLFRVFYQPENTYQKPIRQEALNPYRKEREKGKYIALCEGDDYWTDPLKLEKQVDYLEKNPNCVLCFHDAQTINQLNGKELNKFKIPRKEKITTKDIIIRSWFVPTASIIYRQKYSPLINNYPDWYKKTVHGDLALQLFLSKYGYFHAIRGKSSVYRFFSSSSITLMNKDKNPIPNLIRYTLFLAKANKKHFNNRYLIFIVFRWLRSFGSILKIKLLQTIRPC